MSTKSTQAQTQDPRAIAAAERAKRATKQTKQAPAPETGPAKRKDGRLSARGLPCLCGCGQPTTTKDARFLSGHDAKLRKQMIAAGLDAAALPEIIRPFYGAGETIAGLRQDGDRLVNVKKAGPGEPENEEV